MSKNQDLIPELQLREAILAKSFVRFNSSLKKADVNYVYDDGATPLHLAIENGNTAPFIRNLIQKGARLDIQSTKYANKTAIDLMNSMICTLIEMQANTSSNEEVFNKVVVLLSFGADINYINDNGWTPLHLALNNKNYFFAERILEKYKANPKIISKNNIAKTALDIINENLFTANTQYEVTVLTLLGADINSINHDGWTPLHSALKNGLTDVALTLFTSGSKPDVVSHNQEKKTPADIINECSLIHKAILYTDQECNQKLTLIKTYKYIGADLNTLDTESGWTPLHLAIKNENLNIIELLITLGADKNKISGNMENVSSLDLMNRLLCKMVMQNQPIDEMNKLISLGAEVNATDQDGWTPLHLAIKNEDIYRAKLLLELGSDKTKCSNNTENKSSIDLINQWLCKAILKGNTIEIIELTNLGAEVNAIDMSGLTPVHLALMKGNKEKVFYFKGPEISSDFTQDPFLNSMHPGFIARHFEMHHSKNFNGMLDLIKKSSSATSTINIIIDAHGEEVAPYKIQIQNSGTEYINNIIKSIIEVADNKPIKLFLTCCFGERAHELDVELVQKMPKGSYIISLSQKDRVTSALDFCHNSMDDILNAILDNNEGSYLKLEQLLEVYCITQRFIKNTPKISLFNGDEQKTISIKDYFNDKVLNKKDINISKALIGIISGLNLSEQDLLDSIEYLKNSSNAKIQKSLYKMPNKISDLKNITEYVKTNKVAELLELCNDYFSPTNSLTNVLSEQVIKDRYSFEESENFSSKFYLANTIHALPLRWALGDGKALVDLTSAIVPKHSLLLACAAEQLIEEIGSGSIFDHWN